MIQIYSRLYYVLVKLQTLVLIEAQRPYVNTLEFLSHWRNEESALGQLIRQTLPIVLQDFGLYVDHMTILDAYLCQDKIHTNVLLPWNKTTDDIRDIKAMNPQCDTDAVLVRLLPFDLQKSQCLLCDLVRLSDAFMQSM